MYRADGGNGRNVVGSGHAAFTGTIVIAQKVTKILNCGPGPSGGLLSRDVGPHWVCPVLVSIYL